MVTLASLGMRRDVVRGRKAVLLHKVVPVVRNMASGTVNLDRLLLLLLIVKVVHVKDHGTLGRLVLCIFTALKLVPTLESLLVERVDVYLFLGASGSESLVEGLEPVVLGADASGVLVWIGLLQRSFVGL